MDQEKIVQAIKSACEAWKAQGNKIVAGIGSCPTKDKKEARCALAIASNETVIPNRNEKLRALFGVNACWISGFIHGFDGLNLEQGSAKEKADGFIVGEIIRKKCPPDFTYPYHGGLTSFGGELD